MLSSTSLTMGLKAWLINETTSCLQRHCFENLHANNEHADGQTREYFKRIVRDDLSRW